jgi:hypothetical protein
MKTGMIAIVLIGIGCVGCSSSQSAFSAGMQNAYTTEIQIKPAEEPHQYIVEFKISHVSDKGPTILSSPKIKVKAGEEGVMKVGDNMDWDSIYCTVLITENAGSVDAATRVIVKSQGKETSNTAHTITVKQ